MVNALAFVPVDHVFEAFEEFVDWKDNILPLDFISYMENTWIGRRARKGRYYPPRFEKEIWNVRERTLQGIPRTQNPLEVFLRILCAHT